MYNERAEYLVRRVAETRTALESMERELRDLERKLLASARSATSGAGDEEYYLLPVGAG